MGNALADVALMYLQALSDSDVDAAVDLLADEADFRTPMGVMPGKEAARSFLTGFDHAFPDATFRIDHVLDHDDLVAVEGVYEGTHTGPLMSPDGGALSPTGRRVQAPFVTVFAVAGGKITSHRPYWDVAGFMAQLIG
jgi:steroid delta-isomerase-like uncharacterized protein